MSEDLRDVPSRGDQAAAMSATPPAVERVVYCHRCGSCDDRRLYAPLRDGHVCSTCFRELGSPFPRAEAAPALVQATELRTRERMAARGGTDRHLVRNGKT